MTVFLFFSKYLAFFIKNSYKNQKFNLTAEMASRSNDLPPPYSAVQGQSQRQSAPSSVNTSTEGVYRVFTISLHKDDIIRILNCPDQSVADSIRNVINTKWGVVSAMIIKSNGAVDFKLPGIPWGYFRTGDEPIRARRMISGIIQTLAREGFGLLQSSDISRSGEGKDVLFFENAPVDLDARVFAICFSKWDRVRVIYSPQQGCLNAVQKALKASWGKGFRIKEKKFAGAVEFHLNGFPFAPGCKSYKCQILSQICEQLRNINYKLHASCKVAGTENEMPTWFFRKITNVYH